MASGLAAAARAARAAAAAAAEEEEEEEEEGSGVAMRFAAVTVAVSLIRAPERTKKLTMATWSSGVEREKKERGQRKREKGRRKREASEF